MTCWASLAAPASAQHFHQVKGTLAAVSAGRNEVFGFDVHAAVWRLNTSRTAFVKIPGVSLDQIAVGGGSDEQLDKVWEIDPSDNVYQFNYSTKPSINYRLLPSSRTRPVSAIKTAAIPMRSGASTLLNPLQIRLLLKPVPASSASSDQVSAGGEWRLAHRRSQRYLPL